MKKFYTFFLLVLLTAGLFAQPPQKMSYQAVIRNSSDALVTNTQVGMQISILQGSETGTVVYTETQTPTTNDNGLVSIEIGGGAGFDAINWANNTFFIKTEIDPTGGTNYTITGTNQLLSVPYALNAKTAENAYWVKNGNDLSYTTGKVGIGTNTPLYGLDVSGSNQYGISWIKESTLPHTGVHEAILYIANNSNNASSQANISFAAGNPGHGRGIISATHDVSAGTYNGNLTLKVRNGSTSYLNAINIRSSGNVGINQPNPSTILDVNGVITSTGANFTGTTTVPTPVNATDAATKAYVDNSGKHTIGESYGGGIVFYVYDNGQHGLIASTVDLGGFGIQWYNGTYRYTGSLGDGLGAGEMNTAMIVATQISDNQTGSFAAKVCAEYSVTVGSTTYGDWYLPSKYELYLMYLQKNIVGCSDAHYWSSTEANGGDAWILDFTVYHDATEPKNYTSRVRAVRAF